MMKSVAVGSQNPVKIEAVRQAFAAVWPQEEWDVTGVAAVSGVSDQPMSDAESIRGARTRAQQALQAAGADFGVGLEGGLQQMESMWFDCGWIVVRDAAGQEGIASSLRIITPPRMMELINGGMELGEASDALFGSTNSKQGQGHFGLMTGGVVTREEGYRQGVAAALARFLHPYLFDARVQQEGFG